MGHYRRCRRVGCRGKAQQKTEFKSGSYAIDGLRVIGSTLKTKLGNPALVGRHTRGSQDKHASHESISVAREKYADPKSRERGEGEEEIVNKKKKKVQ